MTESRPTHISVLLLTAVALCAVQGSSLDLVVRYGDDVTLRCESKLVSGQSCGRVKWLFDHSGSRSVDLVIGGQVVRRQSGDKSHRLRLTRNCDLVVKNVTEEDVGHYGCRTFITGQPYQDSFVILSVVSLTEQQSSDTVTFNCSVTTFGECEHNVEWRLQGPREEDEDEDEDIEKSQTLCSASVTFRTRFKSKGYRLTCLVTDKHTNKKQEFLFKSAETSEEMTETPGLRVKPSTTELKPAVTSSEGWFWWVIAVAVVLPALLVIITVIAVVKWIKARQTRMDDNTADSENSISYSSISFSIRNQRKAQFPADGDAVTYSSVKHLSSSTADPSSRHAVNKPNK